MERLWSRMNRRIVPIVAAGRDEMRDGRAPTSRDEP
jgi:hypothetical protein